MLYGEGKEFRLSYTMEFTLGYCEYTTLQWMTVLYQAML